MPQKNSLPCSNATKGIHFPARMNASRQRGTEETLSSPLSFYWTLANGVVQIKDGSSHPPKI